jgi:hypothetical protein
MGTSVCPTLAGTEYQTTTRVAPPDVLWPACLGRIIPSPGEDCSGTREAFGGRQA